MDKPRTSLLTPGRVLLALLLTALVGYGVWFFNTHHRVEVEFRENGTNQSLRNPFLAAQLFLEQQGIPAESVAGIERMLSLPPPGDALVLNNPDIVLTDTQHEELLYWLEQGGHLVTTIPKLSFFDALADAENLDEEETTLPDQQSLRLLRELGISWDTNVFNTDEEDAEAISDTIDEFEQQELDIEDVGNVLRELGETVVTFDTETQRDLQMAFDSRRTLLDTEHRALESIRDENGFTYMLKIPVGEGWVTIFTDNGFMRNPLRQSVFSLNFEDFVNSIVEYDHAWFLWYLLNDRDKVWLLYAPYQENLVSLIWKNALQACISFIVLLVFWLWWQHNRFGPRLESIDRPRRNILEHIRMAARYIWQLDRGKTLLATSRQQAHHHIIRKHPQLAKLEGDAFNERLGELLDIPPATIEQGLFSPCKGEREFIQYSHILQHILNRL